jgi:hypothetical protein
VVSEEEAAESETSSDDSDCEGVDGELGAKDEVPIMQLTTREGRKQARDARI